MTTKPPSSAGRRGPGALLKRAAAALFGVLAAVLVAEVGLRWVAPVQLAAEDLRWASHPTAEFRLAPNVEVGGAFGARINSFGMRGPEPRPSSEVSLRVLCLGDSMTYGPGVREEQTFSAVLGEQARAGRPGVEVLNAGTPSYGTVRELAWLEDFGPRLEPDVVVLGVCLANDVTDAIRLHERVVIDGRLWRADKAPATDRAARWRSRLNNLHLWRLLRRATGRAGDGAAQGVAQSAPTRGGSGLRATAAQAEAARRFRALQAVRLWMYARPDFEEPSIREAYAAQRAALEGVRAWCVERSARLIVVLLPDVLQVDLELFETVLKEADLLREQGDLDRPRNHVLDWASEQGVEVLDMTEPLRDTLENDATPFQFRDIHLSAEGNRLVGAALAERLLAE